MAFPKSRVLNTQQFVRQIIESNRNGERFCFILGSGASVESGIPTGNALEMRWMDCLMGEADDLNYPAMDPEDTRQYGAALYEDRLLEHKFEEIESAWQDARKNGTTIPSEYYFDIFKLRFYPNQRNGYRYLERIMDSCAPSLGYHTLALLLADNTLNNLVITTNFDSLTEDALFLYTDKKPLVVSHESLAGFIESDTQRPIIAKVHRGLMYAPFNTPDATSELKKEWRKALLYAFNTYTPVVIGYGGGDRSLMSFLEESSTIMPHGVYWCYHEASGFPDDKVCSFISDKNGYLVRTAGFDALMLKLGAMLYKDEISYSGTKSYLKTQCDQRIQQYHSQLAELSKKTTITKELRTPSTPAVEKKPEAPKKSAASEPKQPEPTQVKPSAPAPEVKQPAAEAVKQPVAAEAPQSMPVQSAPSAPPVMPQNTAPAAPQSAAPVIPQNAAPVMPQSAAPVVPQSVVYEPQSMATEYHQSAAPVMSQPVAYEITPEYRQPTPPAMPQAMPYEHQSMAAEYRQSTPPVMPQAMVYEPQSMAAEYRQSTPPVVPQPMVHEAPQPMATDIRQSIFAEFRQAEAVEPRQPVIKARQAAPAKPTDSRAQLGAAYYIRQGNRACETRDFDRAISSYQQATRLDPGYALAYYNCGVVYNILHRYDDAIACCSKAIALDPNHVSAYTTRGIAYKNLGQMEEAIGDYTAAVELNPTDASAYNNRGNAYFALGQHQIAVDDYTKAIEYNPSFKRAYLNRAIAYRALGNTAQAEADKITADAL